MSVEMLTGHGRPTKYTAGIKGQRYKDLDTGDIYQCELDNEYSTIHGAPVGGYLWKLRVDGNGDSVVQDGASVKSINGMTPDENGDMKMDSPFAMLITHIFHPTIPNIGQLTCNKSFDQIYNVLLSQDQCSASIALLRYSFEDQSEHYRYCNLIKLDKNGPTGGMRFTLYFGDDIAPYIVDINAETITVDPDWVAPSASTSSDVIVELTATDNNITNNSVVTSNKSFDQITEELNGRGLENVRATLNHKGSIYQLIAVSGMSDRIFFTFMNYATSVNSSTGTETPYIIIYKLAFTKSSGTNTSYIIVTNVKSAA